MNASQRFERSGMFLLIMVPFYSFVTQFFVNNSLICFMALALATLIGSFVAALPKHVGSYSETEVIRYEGGANRGDDPNPDRESRHEIVKEGRRFLLRLPVSIAVCAVSLILLVLVPTSVFRPGSGIYRFGFIALTLVFEAVCIGSVNTEYCFWTEMPGIAIGFAGYLIAALYLHFSETNDGTFGVALGVCALIFLFGAFVCLNRSSLSGQTGDADKRGGVPKALEKRNRRVVLIFAAIISVISFVKPVRDAALWVLRWIAVFFKWLAWLLRGGKEVEKGDLNRILAMQGFGEEMEIPPEQLEEMEEELEQLESTVWDKIFVYAFIALLALGIVFIIYYQATKQQGKKPLWRRRGKKIDGEGYYDEKETIEGDEIHQKYSSLRERLKGLFNRETPWEKLSAREKARRLLKQLYRKKQSGINGIKSLTAREALGKMQLKAGAAEKTAEAYDTARYSEHELKDEDMDALRKELKL